MKYILLIFTLTILYSETYSDVIYLKDGSIIYGTIIEQKPGEYYKIKSGMNTFVFNLDEIDVIKKEVVHNELNSKKNSNNQSWPSGIWLKSSVMNLDSDINDNIDPSLGFCFTKVFENGFEIGLEYWLSYYGMDVSNYWWYSDEKFKPMDLSLIYHKNNLRYGMRITDIFDDSDFNNTATHFIFGYYSNNLNWVTLDYNLKYDETFFDSPLVSGDTSIEFGKLWELSSNMMIGLTYTAGFDDLDQGFIGLSLVRK